MRCSAQVLNHRARVAVTSGHAVAHRSSRARPNIARLQKSTGAETKVIPLASLQGKPAAWAFAFWGGDCWIFVMRTDEADTPLSRVKHSTGELTRALTNTGQRLHPARPSACSEI